jgi:3',5'-cyclic AMP phosphodiesterase CpdA
VSNSVAQLNVLHISDLHFRANANQSARDHRKLVLDDLVSRFSAITRIEQPSDSPFWSHEAVDWTPDVIAISGDIAYSGVPAEYSEATEFLQRLKAEIAKLKNGQQPDVIACPGNHDRDITYASGLVYPKSNLEADEWLCLERLQPDSTPVGPIGSTSSISHSRAPLVVPFHNFQAFAQANGLLCPSLTRGLEYLVGRTSSSRFAGVEFIVMNSSWFCNYAAKGDARNLWLGLPLVQRLEIERRDSTSENKLRIALVHHPKEWFHEEECNSYADRPNAYRLLSRNCDVILSGHVHGSIEPPSQNYGSAIIYTGGATYEGARWRNNFSLLQFDLEEGVVSRRAFEFDPRELRWQEVLHGSANQELRRKYRAVAPTIGTAEPHVEESVSDRTRRAIDADRDLPSEQPVRDPHAFEGRTWKSVFWVEGESTGRRFTSTFEFKVRDERLEGRVVTTSTRADDGSPSFIIRGEFRDSWITGTWQSDRRSVGKDRWGSLQLFAYHGAEGQLRMRGRWIGFNRNNEVNVGQWRFFAEPGPAQADPAG